MIRLLCPCYTGWKENFIAFGRTIIPLTSTVVSFGAQRRGIGCAVPIIAYLA